MFRQNGGNEKGNVTHTYLGIHSIPTQLTQHFETEQGEKGKGEDGGEKEG